MHICWVLAAFPFAIQGYGAAQGGTVRIHDQGAVVQPDHATNSEEYRGKSRRAYRKMPNLHDVRTEEQQPPPKQSPPNYTGWSPGLAAGIEEGWAGGIILNDALSVYAEIKEDILRRWGAKYAHTTLFSGGMKFSDGGKVVEDKMLNAVVEQRGFLAAFTGMSTTAGHDCLYEQSFPVLLNGTMGRLMAAAGVQYEAINVAMGNTQVAPYSMCVDAHAGLQADIISWDMYMMVQGKHPSPPGVELFIRSASVLPRRPAVLIMDVSPDNEKCHETLHKHQVRNDRLHAAGEENDLMEVYREFGLHRMTPSNLVPENTCDDELFARNHLYNSSLKDYPRPTSWHAAPPGIQLVADMLFMHYAKVFLGALERLEDAVPGVTVSQLRGSAPEQMNMRSLRETLGLGPGVVARFGDGEGDTFMGGGRGDILPPPAWCADWMFCSGAGNYRCANSYFPLAGGESSRLLDRIWEGTPAVLNADHSEFFAEPTAGHWAVTLNEKSLHLLEYLQIPPQEGFHKAIDMKWVLIGEEASGPIDFEFETIGIPPERGGAMVVAEEDSEGLGEEKGVEERGREQGNQEAVEEREEQPEDREEDVDSSLRRTTGQGQNSAPPDSRVVVCKPDFIDRQDFTNSTQVRFRLDGAEVPAKLLDQFFMVNGSCATLEVEVGVGWHRVTVEPLESGVPYVAISHLLYPA